MPVTTKSACRQASSGVPATSRPSVTKMIAFRATPTMVAATPPGTPPIHAAAITAATSRM